MLLCMYVLQEHLFDVTDLQEREPIVVSKCGTLRVTFHYQVSTGNDRFRRKIVRSVSLLFVVNVFD